MELERKQDLSVVYFMKDTLVSYPMVEVVDAYTKTDLVLPSVSVLDGEIYFTPQEMGNRLGKRKRFWAIDVFAANKAQRDDLTSIILNNLESGIPVYDYDEGFPPESSPTQIGTLRIEDNSLTATPIRIFPTLVEKMYWRTSIRFTTEYHQI